MRCFVIMPFGNPSINLEHARKLELIYSQWIKPTVESIKVSGIRNGEIVCHRADKESRPGDIISHIIENLIESEIVIADLTGRSPNVFYELGVRHAVNNNTILIAEDLNDIPFDLRGLRTIIYQYEPEHMLNLKSALEAAIHKILHDPEKIDNPVRSFLYNREMEKLIKQPSPPGYDALKSLVSEMYSLRKEFKNHFSEIRHILKLVTSSEHSQNIVLNEQEVDLAFFEGIWEGEGTFCMRVINGELRIPYCYGGNSKLTSHHYNCRLIGNTLFARFEWFHSSTAGYIFYKVESKDKLVGGWWYREDVPSNISDDISRIDDSIPGMWKIVLYRSPRKEFPAWAEKYFEELKT